MAWIPLTDYDRPQINDLLLLYTDIPENGMLFEVTKTGDRYFVLQSVKKSGIIIPIEKRSIQMFPYSGLGLNFLHKWVDDVDNPDIPDQATFEPFDEGLAAELIKLIRGY